jgi:hypothetical protein
VGGQQDRDLLLLELLDELQELVGALGVQPGRGFVQDYQLRILNQHVGHAQPL